MKFTWKTEILPILLVVASIILGFYFYSVFPNSVPIHWNVAGQVDGYGSKFTGSFMLPMILIGMYLLFVILPFIDPKKEKYQQFTKVYQLFRLLIMAAMFGIYIVASLSALGRAINVGVWVPLMIGLLFVIMGNYFGKIKPNWFMGIRTPWTLSSDEVWDKTHRLGGKLFILVGLIMISTPLWPTASIIWLVVAPVLLAAIVPIVYSYVIYKKLKK